jgi:hypothetical protein
MKKLLVLASFVLCSNFVFSQEIGVRWGEVLGNDVALDLMLRSGDGHRLHADLSFGNDFGLELLWDVLYRPLGNSALYWYIGVGPSMLFSDNFLFGISGEVGLEYRFKKLPIAVGADWRPTFFIDDETDFESGGFGVNARFVFGGSGGTE